MASRGKSLWVERRQAEQGNKREGFNACASIATATRPADKRPVVQDAKETRRDHPEALQVGKGDGVLAHFCGLGKRAHLDHTGPGKCYKLAAPHLHACSCPIATSHHHHNLVIDFSLQPLVRSIRNASVNQSKFTATMPPKKTSTPSKAKAPAAAPAHAPYLGKFYTTAHHQRSLYAFGSCCIPFADQC